MVFVRFFANRLNGQFLRSVLPGGEAQVDWVKAAIAYGSDADTLLADCLSNSYRLDIWMRYDHTVPVAPRLLHKLLASVGQNVFCKLIPDVLHSKLIWWKNYGVYVGSANLTDRAWVTNIECGVFLPEEQLEHDGSLADIEMFFDGLAECEASLSLTKEIIQEQENLLRLRQARLAALDEESRKKRKVPEWGGPSRIAARETAFERKGRKFAREWMEGLSILRSLAEQAPMFRPRWLNEDVPPAWQADQFLHAYYYKRVVDGPRHPFEEHYRRNQADPAGAVRSALQWWSSRPEPPTDEDYNCHVRAPEIRALLSKEKLKALTVEEFARVCVANHSTLDHATRSKPSSIGLDLPPDATSDQRTTAFAHWIWRKRNGRNERIDAVLAFVLDGGPAGDFPQRLYEAANRADRKIHHFGT